jgi:hypothetical protein
MLTKTINIQFHRLRDTVRNDPRKAIMVAVVIVTMVAISCRFIFHEPATAPAADFSSLMSDNVDAAPPAPAKISTADAMKQWLAGVDQPAKRNLFTLNLDDYPSDTSINPAGAARIVQDQKDQSLWNDVAKSMVAQADYQRERDVRLKNLQRITAKLRVEKITVGPPARVQVNGETVEANGTIASVHVIQIGSDRITVEKDGVTLDLPLSQ